MKRIIVTTLCLVFAFTVLAFSVSRACAQVLPLREEPESAVAEEMLVVEEMPEDGGEEILIIVPAPKTKVSYYLAYPGLLPDHFLYPIKMIRDRIWLFLTTNKIDKSKLLLLYADKRLGASKALIEGGKKDLGLETLLKSEQYLERAAAQLKDSDEDMECELGNQIYKASLKHEEIMLELKENLDQKDQERLSENIKYARRVQEERASCVKE